MWLDAAAAAPSSGVCGELLFFPVDIVLSEKFSKSAGGIFSRQILRTDVQDGVSTLHIVISNDHGGASGKTTLSIRDCDKPSSYRNQSLVATRHA